MVFKELELDNNRYIFCIVASVKSNAITQFMQYLATRTPSQPFSTEDRFTGNLFPECCCELSAEIILQPQRQPLGPTSSTAISTYTSATFLRQMPKCRVFLGRGIGGTLHFTNKGRAKKKKASFLKFNGARSVGSFTFLLLPSPPPPALPPQGNIAFLLQVIYVQNSQLWLPWRKGKCEVHVEWHCASISFWFRR